MQPYNPYAPPQTTGGQLSAEGFQGFGVWQENGKAVLFLTGAMLPARCAVCNAPGKHRVSKTFLWHEPWLYLLILAGFVVYAIVAAIVRRTVQLDYWLCDAHRKRRTLGLVIAGVGFTLGFILMLVAAGMGSAPFIVLSILAMIGLPIAGGIMARTVTAARIDHAQVWLNAGPEFVASLPASPQTGVVGYGPPTPGAMGYR